MSDHNRLEEFMNTVKKKDPDQPEFHQAVQEVAEFILPFIENHPKYKEGEILEQLIEPERIIQFRVSWINDAGNVQVNRAWRVQFNSALGPYKGGMRFHPSVNVSVLKFLGFEQILKNALTGLPLGGGKGGSDFDPKGKSDHEVLRFCQALMTELYRHIGPNTDVPAGDIGVGAREVAYLYGHYKKLSNTVTGTFTGKGVGWGGSELRTEATGYGLVYFLEHMLAEKNEKIEGKSVLISGSGNVAQYAAEKVIALGGKVITLSDSSGTIHDPEGITTEKLEWVKELKNVERGRIKAYADEFESATYHEGKDPWTIAGEIALPCATQNELNEKEAKALVKNGVLAVAEGANMPCTPQAIEVFLNAKVLYAPGKATNAGGVATSGIEMMQNAQHLYWSADTVDERLRNIMSEIHQSCAKYGQTKNGINYLKGANIAGFVRVADAMLAMGVH